MTDNMKHWDALKTTDPKYTKKVTFGRQFTSINSQWQLEQMTRHFGPVGSGWGYAVEHSVERITDEYVLAIADVKIWAGADAVSFGPVRGMSPIVEPQRDRGQLIYEGPNKDRLKLHFDDDAGKKAMTDALTKGLSHLGLSADVFLGLFDDVKYVNRVAQEFKETPPEKGPASDLVDEADRGLMTGDGGKSQYEVNKHKEALRFTNETLELFKTMAGASDVNVWFATAISPGGKATNLQKVYRLRETFPELGAKIDEAADEARLRTGARI